MIPASANGFPMENFQNGTRLLGKNDSATLVGLNLLANGMHYSWDKINYFVGQSTMY
jgi:hypothetical protein